MSQESAAPEALPEPSPEGTPPQFTIPSLARRMACWFYEGLLLFGVVFISGYLFGTLSQTRHALDNRHGLQAFLFLIFAIYFTWFWSKGQTLAMKTWRIQVVDTAGLRLSQSRALRRYLFSWMWVLPPMIATAPFNLSPIMVSLFCVAWVAVWAFSSRFQSRGQYWHDVWAGTQLVDISKP